MDEILYELREHSLGLNAGRWDYIFSMIKCFRDRPEFVLPDRNDVKMTVPFMQRVLRAAREDLPRARRVRDGRDGGADPVAQGRRGQRARDRRGARGQAARGGGRLRRHVGRAPRRRPGGHRGVRQGARRPAEPDRRSSGPTSTSAPPSCSTPPSTPGEITEEGLRSDVNVGFQYISFWLGGRGAAGINNLMEDAATAEISRSQIWQWIRHGKVTRERVLEVLDEEMAKIRAEVGDEVWEKGRPEETRRGVRAGRARRGVPGVPHAAGVRVAGLGERRGLQAAQRARDVERGARREVGERERARARAAGRHA